ncbi:uncharacterized protein J3D65DRAFT_667540 [Phyllosticta citribraziliensis]|uniref:BTB domain-containing protein n=1 Tax=Phyllosticta citribraziliensis TaxID=989973 RepID=A0ABR1LNR9_9PEZI
MALSKDGDDFRKSIGKLFDTGLYSDAQVVVGTTIFNVHKSVLCTQNAYFAHAFDVAHGFKESYTSVITIEEPANVEVIKAMLEYIYKGDYTVASDTEAQLVVDTGVYAAAEMFRVEGLKQLAAERISSNIDKVFSSSNLAIVLDNVYEYTPEHDRQVRDLFAKAATTKIEREGLLGSATFREAIKENGNFAADIVLAMHKTVNIQAEVTCRICTSTTLVPTKAVEEERAILCDGCNRVYGFQYWNIKE